MISFNDSISPLENSTGILIEKYISVQAAADVTGYNIQYLRRLLRSGTLEGIKIGPDMVDRDGVFRNASKPGKKHI